MSTRRYQIFVSSTYLDLKEARQFLLHDLLKDNHIPMGMELFPATDDELPDYIKSVIDESDYYVLIIGGRYGTIMPNSRGISYTQMEFEYAQSKQIPTLVFIHEHPENLSHRDPENETKLKDFREEVTPKSLGRWTTPENLALAVMHSLSREIQKGKRPGWVRGSIPCDIEDTETIESLPHTESEKEEKLLSIEKVTSISMPENQETKNPNLDKTVSSEILQVYKTPATSMSWRDFFVWLASQHLAIIQGYIEHCSPEFLYSSEEKEASLKARTGLEELGLIKDDGGSMWHLTPQGRQLAKNALIQNVKNLDEAVSDNLLKVLSIDMFSIQKPITWRSLFVALSSQSGNLGSDAIDSANLTSPYNGWDSRLQIIGLHLEKFGLIEFKNIREWKLTKTGKAILRKARSPF